MQLLSENELLYYLNQLRASIQEFDYSTIRNVIFINLESFYSFVNQIGCEGDLSGQTVEDLLTIIEPYIPITIHENNIKYFINAMFSNNIHDSEVDFQSYMMKKTKIEFINLVRNAKTQPEWDYVVNMLTCVRQLREEHLAEPSFTQ